MRCCINYCCYNNSAVFSTVNFLCVSHRLLKNATGECGCLHPEVKNVPVHITKLDVIGAVVTMCGANSSWLI